MDDLTSRVITISLKGKETPFDGAEFRLESLPISIPPRRHESRSFLGEADLKAYLKDKVMPFAQPEEDVEDLMCRLKALGSIKLYAYCTPISWQEFFALTPKTA